jgi:hypothetical protein
MITDEKTGGVYWADLFLALLYSGIILMVIAWIGKQELPNLPEPLANVVGSGWAWMTSASAGALVSFIFRSRLSVLTLIWTVFLTLALGTAAYLVRVPRPIPSEHWEVSESGGPKMTWEVKYNGDAFPCPPSGPLTANTLCTATGWGGLRAVHRFNAPRDNNQCNFFGLVTGNAYTCSNGGPFPWIATITRQ